MTDPKLSALADNGGPTGTALPAMDSPAVDAAPNCVTGFDQRGQQRPIGAACDIGAAEIGADLRSAQTISNPAPSPGSDVAVTATFTNAGFDDAPNTTATIAIPAATSIVSVTPTQGSCSTAGSAATCEIGLFKRTAPVTVIVIARTPQSGVLTSSATVSSPLVDPVLENNTSSVSASVATGTGMGTGATSDGPGPTPGVPGACSNVINGTSKKDRLTGTADGDRIKGRAGPDRIKGVGNADCLYGDGGNDRIVGGSGSDRLFGGAGKDLIKAKDGTRDVVRCGAGRDRVIADRIAKVARDCEMVRRR